jgi:hypothetical protein
VKSKIHSESRKTDNKGVAKLSEYCAFHKPQLTWRPIPNDDIGIDGEIELYSFDGIPIAEIIKVQLKSTEKQSGYIQNENLSRNEFTFYADKGHVDYWQKLDNQVLLIIYDNRHNESKLYAKRIENIDLLKSGSVKVPIVFHKERDLLEKEKSDFILRFSKKFQEPKPIILPVKNGKEKIVTNLLKISFPTNRLFVAPINFDREEVIEKSWETEFKLKKRATAREVIQSALRQKGLKFSSDWTVFNNQIVTFHDLNNNELPLSKIVDNSIEGYNVDEFCSISNDYKNVFKTLVKFCLQQLLFKLDFVWDNEDKYFKYNYKKTIDKDIDFKERWVGSKSAKRTVFKAKYWEKGKIFYCTHFAFETETIDFDSIWYLCISPTWAVTINGNRKSQIGYKKVRDKKKLERNTSVFNHLRFVKYKLKYRDMFTNNYPFLEFVDLVSFTTENVIDENLWMKSENVEELQLLSDEENPSDISNED